MHRDDSAEQLSGTVLATETVAVLMLKIESGGVEQNLDIVGRRELAVVEILAIFLIIEVRVITRILGHRADHSATSD
jgi:hypothetical protein